jgi:hypothetical protein
MRSRIPKRSVLSCSLRSLLLRFTAATNGSSWRGAMGDRSKKSAIEQSSRSARSASVRILGTVLPRSKFDTVSTDFKASAASSAWVRPAASRMPLSRRPTRIATSSTIPAYWCELPRMFIDVKFLLVDQMQYSECKSRGLHYADKISHQRMGHME